MFQTGQQARFDFHGNVIPADADVPVSQGLHHHGDEPQVSEGSKTGVELSWSFSLTELSLSSVVLSHIRLCRYSYSDIGVVAFIIKTLKSKNAVLSMFLWTCSEILCISSSLGE